MRPKKVSLKDDWPLDRQDRFSARLYRAGFTALAENMWEKGSVRFLIDEHGAFLFEYRAGEGWVRARGISDDRIDLSGPFKLGPFNPIYNSDKKKAQYLDLATLTWSTRRIP